MSDGSHQKDEGHVGISTGSEIRVQVNPNEYPYINGEQASQPVIFPDGHRHHVCDEGARYYVQNFSESGIEVSVKPLAEQVLNQGDRITVKIMKGKVSGGSIGYYNDLAVFVPLTNLERGDEITVRVDEFKDKYITTTELEDEDGATEETDLTTTDGDAQEFTFTLLGTGTHHPSPNRDLTSAFVNIDGDDYLIDAPESVQKLLHLNGCGWPDKILLTGTKLSNIAGLATLIETIGSKQITDEVTVFVPESEDAIRNLHAFLNLSQYSSIVSIRSAESAPIADTDSYQVTGVSMDNSDTRTSYLFREKPRRGDFYPEKAEKLGVPRGPKFGRLCSGNPVTTEDGTTVTPEKVMGSDKPGRSLLFTGKLTDMSDVPESIPQVDVLLTDGGISAFGGDTPQNFTAREAGEISNELDSGHLFLLYINQRFDYRLNHLKSDARKSWFSGNIVIPHDGDSYRLLRKDATQRQGEIEFVSSASRNRTGKTPVKEPESSDVSHRASARTNQAESRRDFEKSQEVKTSYGFKCAVCGCELSAPDGSRYLEAAHIYPVAEGGPDSLQNQVSLCLKHHWAFDSGWININTDLSVGVQDSPEVSGYDEFRSLKDDSICVPDDDDSQPNPIWLTLHNKLYGFQPFQIGDVFPVSIKASGSKTILREFKQGLIDKGLKIQLTSEAQQAGFTLVQVRKITNNEIHVTQIQDMGVVDSLDEQEVVRLINRYEEADNRVNGCLDWNEWDAIGRTPIDSSRSTARLSDLDDPVNNNRVLVVTSRPKDVENILLRHSAWGPINNGFDVDYVAVYVPDSGSIKYIGEVSETVDVEGFNESTGTDWSAHPKYDSEHNIIKFDSIHEVQNPIDFDSDDTGGRFRGFFYTSFENLVNASVTSDLTAYSED